ncbi:Protein terminal ear1 [Carex littledalei]|uniref:Protein terminal ear1 n=1 Tax=Carex littledalei TaxID=544730 RepID=A0A833RFY0_9POAL|nr:Protein terminal ear1 [Carex littledalei]
MEVGGNHLNPSAQEFYPSLSSHVPPVPPAMEVGGNLVKPPPEEFYPSLSSHVPPVQFLLPSVLPPFPHFYYPPVLILHPPAEYAHLTRVNDDAVPTNGIVLSMVPRHVTEHDVLSAMECFGAVRAIDMSSLGTDEIVTVHFYDLRSAQAAFTEVRDQHVRQQSRLGQLYFNGGPMAVAPWGWPEASSNSGAIGSGLICGQEVWAHFAVCNVELERTSEDDSIAGRENGASSLCLFQESEDGNISSSNDERTTVMIRNIPNNYSRKLLLNMLDNHCKHCNEQIVEGKEPPSAYDFVYLRIDFRTKSNVGYGFVNLTSPQAAIRLYKAFHKKPWKFFNSRKICEVTYAKLQGLEALIKFFKYKRFACDNHNYMPTIFSPPRDGKQSLTEPVAIGRLSKFPLASLPLEQLVHSQGGDASSTSTLTHALSVACGPRKR